MVVKDKNRDQIPNEYKWRLEDIYVNKDAFYNELDICLKEIDLFNQYNGNILLSSNQLLSILELDDKVKRMIDKLYVYACMHRDQDTTNNDYQTMVGKVENLVTKYQVSTSFIVPELLQTDYELVNKYINENNKLATYAFMLKKVYKEKEHFLTPNEEKIMSNLSNVLNDSKSTYGLLTNADMTFGNIKDEEGNDVALTNSNYTKHMSSKNRDTRKMAFEKMYLAYGSHKNTIASTLASNIKKNVQISKIRKYNSTINMALDSNNIDPNIMTNLIKTVNENLDSLHRYYALKKEVLKLDELNIYDIYVRMVESSKEEYNYEDAKELVIKALSPLGETYISDLKQAFTNGWIDVYDNIGKRSGAYSWGSYDTNPYILLNYQNKLKDVSTLAHELGHSMHSYYSRKNNDYVNADYKIFVAEVASTVNEMLLYKYLLNNTSDRNEKLNILNELLELFKGTLYRQTMFAEFEKDLYDMVENNEVLTEKLISETYYNINKKYFGDDVIVNDEIRLEWARIPHFYTYFYVYQYATGLSAACHIVNRIMNNELNAKENYLEFLKSGDRNYPTELLKIAGIDINSEEVIISAIKMFDETLEEFKKIYNEF